MKRAGVVVCASVGLAGVISVGVYREVRRVPLPVYDQPITFFQEGKQSLKLASLPEGVPGLSARACGSCHRREHAQWQASAHGRSTTEPVFQAAFRSEPRFVCRSCHSPLEQQQPKLVHQLTAPPQVLLNGKMPDRFRAAEHGFLTETNPRFDAALAGEGVTCVTCHVREGTVLTSRSTGSPRAPHPLSYSPQLSKAEFCAGCHQFRIESPATHPFERKPELAPSLRDQVSPVVQQKAASARHALLAQKAPAPSSPEDPPVPPEPGIDEQYRNETREQSTLDEFRLGPSGSRGQTCQTCHMPGDPGRAGHRWPGRNDREMLRRAVSLAVKLDRSRYRSGDTLQAVIRLKNDAGHRFPTGDSLHAGLLDVWLQDGPDTLGRQEFVMSTRGTQPLFTQRVQTAQAAGLALELTGATTRPSDGILDVPSRADSRLLAGEETTLLYHQPVRDWLARARNPVLRVRVFHCGVHPGFRGSSVDPGVRTMNLIREEVLPIPVVKAGDGSR